MNRVRKRNFAILCVVLMVVLQVVVTFMTSHPQMPDVIKEVPNRSLFGVLNMFQVLIGVGVVLLDWKNIAKAAIVLLFLSGLNSLHAVLVIHHLDALPGTTIFFAGAIILIVMRKQYGKRYREANTDQLTGIANRRRFMQELQYYIGNGQPFYFVYMNLKGFKHFNDEFGHGAGDKLLHFVATYWQDLLSKDGFVARSSSDEFCMVIPEKNVDDIVSYIKPFVYDITEKKIETEDGSIYDMVDVKASVVKYPLDAKTDEELIRMAGFAMRRAKKNTSSNHCIFDAQLAEKANAYAKVEELVKKGFENNNFYMVYQPQFGVATKKLRGFESLIRLKDEDGNVVSPGAFIPIMEKTGAILKMDYFVLNMTLKQMLPVVLENPDLKISVNISARHISDEEFAGNVDAILKETKFPPSNLEIEITEYSFIKSQDDAIATLERLKKMGVMIALDDFGTGYSSLSMVFNVPLDLIKIDKSMIDHIHTDENVKKLVGQIISIGETLHCELLSEGIEQQEQADALRELGCHYIQGYLWGRPMEFEDACKLVG